PRTATTRAWSRRPSRPRTTRVIATRSSTVETAREIPGHVHIADLWVAPDQSRSRELARLGLLGKMVGLGPCLIEPFSTVPQGRDIHPCILEQYGLNGGQTRDARREGKA